MPVCTILMYAWRCELTKLGNYLVPKVLRYNGDWDVVMKKRERCIFTATLFDFKSGLQQAGY